jgi:hypothetical protein
MPDGEPGDLALDLRAGARLSYHGMTREALLAEMAAVEDDDHAARLERLARLEPGSVLVFLREYKSLSIDQAPAYFGGDACEAELDALVAIGLAERDGDTYRLVGSRLATDPFGASR